MATAIRMPCSTPITGQSSRSSIRPDCGAAPTGGWLAVGAGLGARQPERYSLFAPGLPACPPEAVTPYRVHERCLERFRVGRVLFAGDAAHLVNPIGGLGLTGGSADCSSLADALCAVIEGRRDQQVLDAWAAQVGGNPGDHRADGAGTAGAVRARSRTSAADRARLRSSAPIGTRHALRYSACFGSSAGMC